MDYKPGSEYVIVLEHPNGERVEKRGCVDDLLGVGPESNFTMRDCPWKTHLEQKWGRKIPSPD
jgi:hypothetical protein